MADVNILKAVQAKLTAQRNNTANAHKQAVDSLQQADFELESAARVLIKKFGNPQGTVQIIQAVYQADTLQELLDEMDAMLEAIAAQIPAEAPPAANDDQTDTTQEEEQGVSVP